ncbi:MAG: 2-oxoglutarate dehydrogenase E1 component [Phycisphaerales bacterium]|nr:2-oxoglutarate dehydrogenase E1 component [Phycisphaerales bacterium]
MTAAPRPPRAIRPAINGWSADYLEAQYQQFKQDTASVPEDLRSFFQGFDLAMAGAGPAEAAPAAGVQAPRFAAAIEELVAAYRQLGHLASRLDPFGRERVRPEELSPSFYGLTDADLDTVVYPKSGALPSGVPLRAVVEHLEQTYCRTIGVEVMHVQDMTERRWLLERVERDRGLVPLDRGMRAHILEQLLRAEEFEKFLGKRYPGEKRFSLEGSESLIPLLDRVLRSVADLGVEEIVLGMAHRGRLNVLNNIMGKTYEQIFTEFEDTWSTGATDGGGDVKYHRGYSGVRQVGGGRSVQLAMASNPSHLESVGPVVMGRCRAKQRLRGDLERRRVIPVVIHGDAALPGQGVVTETLNFSQLEGYTAGGAIHVVVNNMIGFTTAPEDGRSSRYCTDVAKFIDAPVFHVNGEDPEAVVAVATFAAEYRQRFKKDAFVDMYCFRKYGHNEGDEASFTQPLLYALIKRKPSVLKVYAERLLAEGVISEADMTAIRKRLDDAFEAAQKAAKTTPYDPTIDPGSAKWKGMGKKFSFDPVETGVPTERLGEVCGALGRVPEGFHLNPKLKHLLAQRAEIAAGGPVSHADAELLAVGTLLLDGVAVRLSGQDSRRGTFSQRHAVVRDQETGQPYTPLNHMREVGNPGTDAPPGSKGPDGRPRQAKFCVYDSPLSEMAVMGFEYGYSLSDPNMLVMWEAQFGDFVNGAQVIIDQYLASAAAKWQRWSGLVLLLPHGYEGAGPEHSSARLERFLQLCAADNLQVVYPSTGPQVFHLLRRQVRRSFRKPLIVMTPKSMLRVPTGSVTELMSGRFQEVIDDPSFSGAGVQPVKEAPGASHRLDAAGVKRVILCTGKVYHELAERRGAIQRKDLAIIRVEQLYPLHRKMLDAILARYPAGAERVWVQEEPQNAGAYTHMAGLLTAADGKSPLPYIGRDAAASPAVGSKTAHKAQQEQILTKAVGPLPAAAPGAKH